MSHHYNYRRSRLKAGERRYNKNSRKAIQREFKLRIHPRVRSVLDKIGIPDQQSFVPDPFQIEALEAVEERDVLVTAPTGAGKTYIAIKAIEQVHLQGGRCWYASPLKALSNAKYEEFIQIFGAANIGILTGDRKENPHAPIIVGTTEILRNQLYDAMHRGEDLEIDLVVLDEAHYLGDEDRGVVWEEVLIYLPSRVRLLLLSATIRNAEQVCDWLTWLRQHECCWVTAHERPVPLFPLFLFPNGELTPLGSRRGTFPRIDKLGKGPFSRRDFPPVERLMNVLRETNLLPAIFFLKSRADCERAITLCPRAPSLDKNRHAQSFNKRLDELLKKWPFLRQHRQLAILRRARVGAHHGGQLPHWKLLLENLMQDGYLEAIFSTSTVAAGVNFPARTVVILQSDRFNGREFVDISATDLLQMTGRAGRRGMDEIGFVLVVPGYFQNPNLIHDLLTSPPDPVESQIRVNFSMVLNLLLSHHPDETKPLFASSFATYQNLASEKETKHKLAILTKGFSRWVEQMACGSPQRLAEIRHQYMLAKDRRRKLLRNLKRDSSLYSSSGLLTPGRLFLNRRGTCYVVIQKPDGDADRIEAVRLAAPIQWRRNGVVVRKVRIGAISELGKKIKTLPDLNDRNGWEKLAQDVTRRHFSPLFMETTNDQRPGIMATTEQLKDLALYLGALPCSGCALFGPCQKLTGHPFSRLIQRYFRHFNEIHSVQDLLWRSFQRHYKFLQDEGYVDQAGALTDDGLWASKLRIDQPLLISEGIRKEVFPEDDPALLAALIAPFVMDRERSRESPLAALVWKYPDLARPYFVMLQALHRLKEHLQAEGFPTPPLPFWTVVTLYYWATGETWENIISQTGIDEGDLAMVILRTADHLRQIESLRDISSMRRLADTASVAIRQILREPVVVQ